MADDLCDGEKEMKNHKKNEQLKKEQKRFFDEWITQKEDVTVQTTNSFEQFYTIHNEKRITDPIASLISETDGHLILDIGCGSGKYSLLAASIKENTHLVCADMSPNSIKQARQRISSNPSVKSDVSYVVCDAENLPFKAQVFDATMIIMLLHHLPRLNALKQVHRVLKNDRKLLIIDIVSNNPIREFGKRIFRYMPGYVKKSMMGEDLILSDGEIPDTFAFTANSLRANLFSAGFKLCKEERHDLFIFILYYIIKIVPPLRYLFPVPVLKLFFGIEKAVMRIRFVREFSDAITCWCTRK